jgi:hypothetical protein
MIMVNNNIKKLIFIMMFVVKKAVVLAGLLKYRGSQCDCNYAETFMIARTIN